MATDRSPAALGRTVRRAVRGAARRVLGIEEAAVGELKPVDDALPRDSLFVEPLTIDTVVNGDPELLDDGQHRVTFRVTVKDATGKRCTDLHVEAAVTGPDRTALGETTTDMLGGARFRMTGPPGEYSIEVREVAALALAWDKQDSTTTAAVTVG